MTMTDVPQLPRPTLLSLVRDQRKIVLVAVVLMVAAFWVLGPVASWPIAICAAGGVFLGLLNHLTTELWLGRVISGGETPTRAMLTRSTIVRLGVLSVIALGIAFTVGSAGIALIFGLAIFRLIALVMTGLPLLKELKNA